MQEKKSLISLSWFEPSFAHTCHKEPFLELLSLQKNCNFETVGNFYTTFTMETTFVTLFAYLQSLLLNGVLCKERICFQA